MKLILKKTAIDHKKKKVIYESERLDWLTCLVPQNETVLYSYWLSCCQRCCPTKGVGIRVVRNIDMRAKTSSAVPRYNFFLFRRFFAGSILFSKNDVIIALFTQNIRRWEGYINDNLRWRVISRFGHSSRISYLTLRGSPAVTVSRYILPWSSITVPSRNIHLPTSTSAIPHSYYN